MIETLAQWAHSLCHLATGGRHDVFGIATYVEHADYAEVSPPPDGVARLRIVDDLTTHTVVQHLDVELADGVTFGDLQTRFGAGRARPRLHIGSAYVWDFRIEIPGAPCTVDLCATFGEAPTDTSRTTSIIVRRNPSPPSTTQPPPLKW